MASSPNNTNRNRATTGKSSKSKKPIKTTGDNPPCACVPPAPDGLGQWVLKAIDGVITWENVTPSAQKKPLDG